MLCLLNTMKKTDQITAGVVGILVFLLLCHLRTFGIIYGLMSFPICKNTGVLLFGANKNYGSNYPFFGKCNRGINTFDAEK